MPPKLKLHKTKSTKPIQPSGSNGVVLNPEMEEQFETELYWCIEQLQNGLRIGKLNQRETQDHRKALNVLMSNKEPLIRKRQVMRLSFGDYREKMKVEEKKMSKAITNNFKITSATPHKKSVCLKSRQQTSDISSKTDQPQTDKFVFVHSDNSFKFNFDVK